MPYIRKCIVKWIKCEQQYRKMCDKCRYRKRLIRGKAFEFQFSINNKMGEKLHFSLFSVRSKYSAEI